MEVVRENKPLLLHMQQMIRLGVRFGGIKVFCELPQLLFAVSRVLDLMGCYELALPYQKQVACVFRDMKQYRYLVGALTRLGYLFHALALDAKAM